jgi:hypothetical protein
VTAAPTAVDERFLRFPRRCCCAIRVKGDYAPPAAAAQASVLVGDGIVAFAPGPRGLRLVALGGALGGGDRGIDGG